MRGWRSLRRTTVQRPVRVVTDQDDFLVLLHTVWSFNGIATLPSDDQSAVGLDSQGVCSGTSCCGDGGRHDSARAEPGIQRSIGIVANSGERLRRLSHHHDLSIRLHDDAVDRIRPQVGGHVTQAAAKSGVEAAAGVVADDQEVQVAAVSE